MPDTDRLLAADIHDILRRPGPTAAERRAEACRAIAARTGCTIDEADDRVDELVAQAAVDSVAGKRGA